MHQQKLEGLRRAVSAAYRRSNWRRRLSGGNDLPSPPKH
ncbi:hypothetical protein HMPREF0578_0702 [Mobiluncus mulieris 28-1]|nr:hypothetical protein HMPREF0578_0702 [Mobiluncus mulieris 28-1]